MDKLPFRVIVLLPLVTGFLAVLCGIGINGSDRKGVLKNRWGRFRRAQQPVTYWVGIFGAVLAFVLLAAATIALLIVIVHDTLFV